MKTNIEDSTAKRLQQERV